MFWGGYFVPSPIYIATSHVCKKNMKFWHITKRNPLICLDFDLLKIYVKGEVECNM